MNFSISAGTFSIILKQCSRVASRKGDVAASHVLIDVQAGQLSVCAQNGAQQIVRRTGTSTLSVTEAGTVCVAAHKMDQIVSAMPAGSPVKVALVEDKLVLTCARSRFSLATMAVDSFPRIEVGTPSAEFKINADMLRDAGKTVAVCCARDDVRQYLNGLLISIDTDGQASLVASDGHRMGVCDFFAGADAPATQVIIPISTVDDFLSFATETEVLIRLYPNLAAVVSEAGEFYTKLVDGKYPDFRRLTQPLTGGTQMTVNRIDLLAAVQRAGLMADERSLGVRLQASSAELSVSSISTSASSNSALEHVEVSAVTGEVEVGFNARYLGDILKSLSSEEVEFTFGGTSSGTHISPTNSTQQKFVLMPMRV